MSANIDPIFPVTPKTPVKTILNADGTTAKSLLTSGANGARLDQLRVCSDSAVDVTLQFFSSVDGGSTWAILGEVPIPAGAGTDGATTWVEALDDLNSGESLTLMSLEQIGAAAKTQLVNGKTITIVGRQADY